MALETVTSREGGGRGGRVLPLEGWAPRRGMAVADLERSRGRLKGAIVAACYGWCGGQR